MCNQNNLRDLSVLYLKLKRLMCDQNNLKTNLLQTSNLKDSLCNLAYKIYNFLVQIRNIFLNHIFKITNPKND